MTEFSLVFLRRGEEFLLARKSRSIGTGCWNGYGGKKEPGETILECARRELFEESGVQCRELIDAGLFVIKGYCGIEELCIHMFVGENWEGVPQETVEMQSPTWFKVSEIPYNNLLPTTWYWFPFVHRRQRIMAEFAFEGPKHDEISTVKINVVGSY